ncbi:hypothetical protein FGG08_007254 [Glutinoglossum americanum]|uniref:PIG-P domain-containing protein n=1 Tax=Glutinoglossum americanum TaxID=1670608 RepID=A0A9P8HZQ1_9PEZI|nr:hypothetical protein FGG08_007254 [Glutinoglossum americanum]
MAPQSRGGTTSTGAPPLTRGLQSYSLSSPNLRTLSSLEPSPSVHQRSNGNFAGHDNDGGIDDSVEEDEDGDGDTDDADFQRHYSLDGDGGEESGSEAEDDDEESGDDNRPDPPFHRPTFRRSASDNLPQATLPHQTTPTFPPTPNPNHHFAPPFYNRPPTPLPPSPSLTSLLRPPFSAARLTNVSPSRRVAATSPSRGSPSRPATSGSGRGGAAGSSPSRGNANAAESSSRLTTPADSSDEDTEARAEEVARGGWMGGADMYVCVGRAVIYILWSYLPSPFLHALGIYYYPNRWWSLAIPSFLVMSLVYIYVALAAYNTEYLTLPIESIENIVDEVANIAVLGGRGGAGARRGGSGGGWNEDGNGKRGRKGGERWGGRREGKAWREFWGEGTDAVLDVPVGGVCEVLYGEGREWIGDEEGEEEVGGEA